MRTLNLGILAHVDAGKTTLSERLLYAAGAIHEIGRVDDGTTQTDSLALERERGITIKSAVASFAIGDLAVNLIDTPGHPDFIAEVERVLSVLDGAVLVVSAVEGVQPQTPLLMRALERQRVPTLLFINKIDRPGASDVRTLDAIARRLTPDVVAMVRPEALGTRDARVVPTADTDAASRARIVEALAEHDEAVLERYVAGRSVAPERMRELLAEQTAIRALHPVYFGAAITGVGVDALMTGIAELLPAANADAEAPAAGRVFKIERTPAGEKVAFVRLLSGTLRMRDRVRYGPDGTEGTVTALSVFAPGGPESRSGMTAGEIGRVSGLGAVRIGDAIGDVPPTGVEQHFPRPTLESVVVPRHAADSGRLRGALAVLSEQDPLIDVRQDDERHEVSVSLYGEVQKEVIQATLAREHGIEVTFRETTTVHVERVTGTGEALEILSAKTKANVTGKSSPLSTNPFPATLGLRVSHAPIGSGVTVRLDVDVKLVPIYIFRTVDDFVSQMRAYARDALEEGLYGWAIPDCEVTVIDCGYRAPTTTAGDFRKLTPLVLVRALERAGTEVCQPMSGVRIDAPVVSVTAVLSALASLGARVDPPAIERGIATMTGVVAAGRVHELQRRLPTLTAGEGVLETRAAGYEPVVGRPPTRGRTTPDPRNRDEYLTGLARRG